jgi:molybdate transport system regulatory protein
MARLSIRIDFEPSGSALGPGMVQLLERLAEHGAIRRAAASMGMSYRKAWLLIQEMQETFNGAVVTTEVGGTAGGGAQLTELGTTLLRSYRHIENRATRAAEADLQALAAMLAVDCSFYLAIDGTRARRFGVRTAMWLPAPTGAEPDV